MYHFKVIQLRQFEDVKKDTERFQRKNKRGSSAKEEQPLQIASECKLLYHFFHKLLHPFKSDQKHFFEKSDWFLNYDNIKQRLYLSVKAEKMLEVLQNRLAIIWQ